MPQVQDPLSQAHHRRIVRGQHQTGAAGGKGADCRQQGGARGAVQLSGRLVSHHHRRVADGGPGEGEPLLLATGQLVGQVVAAIRQSQQFQQLPAVGVADATQTRGQLEVLGHAEVGNQIVGRPLEHIAEEPAADPAQAGQRQPRQPHPADLDLAGARPVEAGQEAQQRRLAGAGGPDHGAHRRRREHSVDPFERVDLASGRLVDLDQSTAAGRWLTRQGASPR